MSSYLNNYLNELFWFLQGTGAAQAFLQKSVSDSTADVFLAEKELFSRTYPLKKDTKKDKTINTSSLK